MARGAQLGIISGVLLRHLFSSELSGWVCESIIITLYFSSSPGCRGASLFFGGHSNVSLVSVIRPCLAASTFLVRIIRGFFDDFLQEIERLIFHDSLFEVSRRHPLTRSLSSLGGSFGDKGDDEEFQGLC